MRLDNAEQPAARPTEAQSETAAKPAFPLTPARRAALDALERELRELLQGRSPA